ncbi:MAG: hypothetical protein IJ725_03440, partial [Ruminococcus sp.]|nr:hypothetical protein [Ruminococcus sp.]
MDSKPIFRFINERAEKQKTVVDFSRFYYNQSLSEKAIKDLSLKVADNAVILAVCVDKKTAGFTAYY